MRSIRLGTEEAAQDGDHRLGVTAAIGVPGGAVADTGRLDALGRGARRVSFMAGISMPGTPSRAASRCKRAMSLGRQAVEVDGGSKAATRRMPGSAGVSRPA